MSDWNEEAFLCRVQGRAAELGLSIADVLRDNNVHHSVLRRERGNRRIDTLERLAAGLKWTLPELLGFETRLDVEISGLAFAGAQTVIDSLPHWAQTPENFVEAHASLYDLLIGRKREGNLPEGAEARNDIIELYVEMLVRAWSGPQQPSAAVRATLSRLRFPKRKPEPS